MLDFLKANGSTCRLGCRFSQRCVFADRIDVGPPSKERPGVSLLCLKHKGSCGEPDIKEIYDGRIDFSIMHMTVGMFEWCAYFGISGRRLQWFHDGTQHLNDDALFHDWGKIE